MPPKLPKKIKTRPKTWGTLSIILTNKTVTMPTCDLKSQKIGTSFNNFYINDYKKKEELE